MNKEIGALQRRLDALHDVADPPDERERHDIYFAVITALTRLKQAKAPRPVPKHAKAIIADLTGWAQPMGIQELTKLGLEIETTLNEWLKDCRRSGGYANAAQ
jgi:hypothetical protein